MKSFILLFSTIFLMVSCKAQTVVDISTFNQGNNSGKYFKDLNNSFQNFLGTWEGSMSANRTFRINLFKITKEKSSGVGGYYYKDRIGGSFQIIDNAHTPNEIIIHNSVKYYPQNNLTTNNVMYFSSSNGIVGGGFMYDNGSNDGNDTFTVRVVFEILNLGNSPLQMHWGAKRNMMFENWHLSIPQDIILTKQP